MLLNSYEFCIFFTAVFCLYWAFPLSWKAPFLLGVSYFFYGLWDPHFLLLIGLVTGVDYSLGCALGGHTADTSKPTQLNTVKIQSHPIPLPRTLRKRLLLLSIITNLSILGCFKYFNFFVDSVARLFAILGWQVDLVTLQLLLPIGISFYSFKSLGYVIDVYRDTQAPERNWVHYALFIAFFPTLLAGPIDRAKSFLPQIKQLNQLTLQRIGSGLTLILMGVVKKVAIADGIAHSVNIIYQGNGSPSWLDIVTATVLYAVQIYGDFSGYTDMARGVAKLLGFDLVINFNLPYFSQNPSEFWRRWHISLSTWLRDYLYISLGGNRRSNLRTYINLMATMMLGGLWHGATWNFVLWGTYQGGILGIHRWFSLRSQPEVSNISSGRSPQRTSDRLRSELPDKNRASPPAIDITTLWKIPLFFIVTCYGWLLFGVADFSRILKFSQILLTDFGNFTLSLPMPPLAALLGMGLLLSYEALEYLSQTTNLYRTFWPIAQGAFYATLIFIILMGSSNEPTQFIYTQF